MSKKKPFGPADQIDLFYADELTDVSDHIGHVGEDPQDAGTHPKCDIPFCVSRTECIDMLSGHALIS